MNIDIRNKDAVLSMPELHEFSTTKEYQAAMQRWVRDSLLLKGDNGNQRKPITLQTLRAKAHMLETRFGDLHLAALWMIGDDAQRSLRPSTYRGYRLAIEQTLTDRNDQEGLLIISRAQQDFKKAKTAKASTRRRRKTVTPHDIKKIADWLDKEGMRRSKKMVATLHDARYAGWPIRTLAMFLATIGTGLRPSEWQHVETRYDADGMPYLWVRCAKTQGDIVLYRRVPWPLDGGPYQVSLSAHMEEMGEFMANGGSYEQYLRTCRRWLHKANHAVFTDRKMVIDFLSGRHTFHAKLLNDGEYSLADIAAIMGHSTMTDQVYGKGKRSGGFGASVQAVLTPTGTDPKLCDGSP
ncbi:hypothetical protein [Halothiobacillus sp.]|jgi:hypothetical protein|uniref:hypothetical protein n=1 Tax=Halothiobacillus sp. TaxID=1891311 RepID=UPI002620DE86|nr:hypothetical protein [Halothiobacillus sp.]